MESCKEAPVVATSPSKTATNANSDLKAKILMLASPLRAGLGRQSLKEMPKESPKETPKERELTADHMAAHAAGGAFVPAPVAPSTGLSMRADAPAFVPGRNSADDKPAGPPVVSVRRMPAKGCAIVLLRDKAVLELSVAMRVAVVDGVCVEVRKHTRKREQAGENATDEPEGVFVAWGHRVARKVDISEEGLEAYFNGLSTLDWPSGLALERPFEEQIQSFLLSSVSPLPLNASPKLDDAVAAKMLEGIHGQPELVQELWDAKEQLDDLWKVPPPPLGRGMMQRVARDQLFPHSGKEGEKHENRAGEKLEELSRAVGLLEGVPVGAAFLDLCGGPGAWSQYMLERKDLKMYGFGMTLRAGAGAKEDWKAEEKDMWYPGLVSSAHWQSLWGADGSGDLLKLGNVEHAAAAMNKATVGRGVFLCLADGGFSDDSIPANQLELYCYRLFLAEVLMATSCLQPGGHFVCKLYSTFSQASAALLALIARLFADVAVVKPRSSKATGPERYLVAKGYRAASLETADIKAALAKAHALGKGSSPLLTPLLTPLVAAADLAKDANLVQQLRTMTTTICERNTRALNAVVDRAEYLEDMATNVNSEMQMSSHEKSESSAAVEAPRIRRRGRLGVHGGA